MRLISQLQANDRSESLLLIDSLMYYRANLFERVEGLTAWDL
jgi:hypothetical protein